ncbi:photosystem reaction center subunit H [Methanosarcina sp. 2.H.T.1A.6]|uniref:PRC-barrel domain-containing protein n=1 Tax=unclassified Methanosarcina TaxID=2644672 RepID=UPI00062194A2|nr:MULTISPECIES: PRC-barrel domain-containing protein [unclassified Methanosarcina]KKG13549.1 photosystem reaction center subunit H [Methanosarcina sp. 2.H.T.1A.3]KKG13953.1 photosystem reaction center subunit H [Methanosarcina sp. 2.H.T.1A.15]KKG24841.1 photosystem reaction center subunit H [Methanosarcina sp. 2.H.T.1A.6]KKG26041.1 photosystem reaction center subunit H [Methanosarcina sp. 2.H.T.1A.8]
MREELTSLFGLSIYTNNGVYVGKLQDLVIDVEEQKVTGLAVSDINRELFDLSSRGIIIPYRWVITAADIIIIRDVIQRYKKRKED